jgi:protein-tyrosine phosphatase
MVTRVLFVCLGNICRSPAAEGVFRHLVADAGLSDRFVIDSAGTGAWHIGEPADPRMCAAARRRGVTLTGVARQVTSEDFDRFDYILAMDTSNLRHLRQRAPSSHRAKVHLFRDFDPLEPGEDVPDPYYGDHKGFDEVLDIVARTARALLAHLTVPAGERSPERAH